MSDANGRPTDLLGVELPVRVHATTGDGMLDVRLNARGHTFITPAGEHDEISFEGHALLSTETNVAFGAEIPHAVIVTLSGESNQSGVLEIRSLLPKARTVVSDDITPSCLNSEGFLGESELVKQAEW